ncbi:hypothetical protein MTBBW1_2030060 [Desulfamplus magnetovallimortis]|uniref:Glycosyltransferase 2-like domain-containing protein n=1 Tax=Desulfamplus magnetovallimortis TaxID=1246637 RepID=A0A1W1HBW4_9BACT|nr:glycosyltransferase [Desulfamplus magnetovallimortis]SLM29970.1 hypothetical protein MTBBW1_2030060 [Desulfamplus magnetovallimortis]
MQRCFKDSVSIIIPTYNRSKLLKKVLKALENQSLEHSCFEVIVVDDGSKDDTFSMVADFEKSSSLRIRYFFQENKKQAAARNLAIQHAVMPLLLFIGDDIVPDSDFLESHLKFHASLENPDKSCVIGYTTWPCSFRVTPFMEYIGEFGDQFGYSLIQGNSSLPFNFYYTSNLLVPAEALKQLDYFFDEDFHVYGWEDIEFGFRLEKSGMLLFYNPEAVARHYHPVDVLSFCQRQKNVGYASTIFIKKHPELEWLLGNRQELLANARRYPVAFFLKFIINLMDKCYIIDKGAIINKCSIINKYNIINRCFKLSLTHKVYRFVLDAHYARAAISESVGKNAA